MNSSPILAAVVITLTAVAMIIGYVAYRRTFRTSARQKLEQAAGGRMSAAALAAFDRRDRRSEPWKIGGVALGLISFPVTAILHYPLSVSLFCLLMFPILGSTMGNIIAGLTPLTETETPRRVASLTPRSMTDYVSAQELRSQHIALGLPVITLLIGILTLIDRANPLVVSIALLSIGSIGIALGVVAPLMRRRLLDIPNHADTTEIAFWNNAIVSRAICDLTAAVSTFALTSGALVAAALIGNSLTGSLRFTNVALPGVVTIVVLLVVIGGAALAGIMASGRTVVSTTYIRLNPPHRGSAA